MLALRVPSALALALAIAFVAGSARLEAADPTPLPGVGVAEAWPGVTFTEPTFIVSDGSPNDLFVGEQGGRILKIAKWRGTGEVPRPAVWLDLRSRVNNEGQGGLLGCAFHPKFATSNRVYVCYLAKGPGGNSAYILRVAEFTCPAGGPPDPASERTVLEVHKSRNIHQGGGLAFGPDGMLYLGVGDGGGAVDATTVGSRFPSQTTDQPLGKILRMDATTPGKCVPCASNPWISGDAKSWMPWIYAYGFRNPWQLDWDANGRLFTAEPGTSGDGSREWVTEVRSGGNHGWPYFEGDRPLAKGGPAPEASDLVMPALVYQSGARAGAAVGGKFYRGGIEALKGRYLFADYMRGEVYSLDLSSGRGTDWRLIGNVPEVSTFGVDAQGEVYVASHGKGTIWRVVPR